ncbi:hypothetical protein [Bacillus sp. KH172YL63]|uniref:hypothetical protein n=1 Tax=Bacillus sp. KH172YL63 TaxID=2709784 RepID=UPI0013E4878A|nr:hypothetical protein [Bacillus sp. KH172YL63]BCB03976.1 hypothetical protein KH172YL63_21090 [Bacillus sp. KH172YL63]
MDSYYLEVDSEVNLLSSSPGLENSDLSVHIIIAGTDREVDSEKLVAVYQDLMKMRFKQFTLSFALFDEETQPFFGNMKETGYENYEQSHRQTASCSLTFPGGNVDASNVLNHCE